MSTSSKGGAGEGLGGDGDATAASAAVGGEGFDAWQAVASAVPATAVRSRSASREEGTALRV